MVLSSTWDHDFLTSIIGGIKNRLENENIGIHIFNAYDNVYEANYYEKECEIFGLPNIENYIGLICVLNSVDSIDAIKAIADKFRNSNKPVVSMDAHIDGAAFVGLDNYKAMYSLVEHLVKTHDCKTFNYIGGPESNEENKERLRAFLDCLNAYNIEVDSRRIRHYRFTQLDGNTAYFDFKREGLNLPDAVVCANDYMAIGYCSEAEKDGYAAPRDFIITGFDNVTVGQFHFPSITSVNRNWEQLGFDAAEGLLHMVESGNAIRNHYTLGYVKLNESCGCEKCCDMKHDYAEMLKVLASERILNSRLCNARQVLGSSYSFEQFRKALYRVVDLLELNEIAVCINENFFRDDKVDDNQSFPESVVVYTEDSTEKISTSETVLPSCIFGFENTYIFSSLHFGKQLFGYCVMPFEDDRVLQSFHRVLMESISLGIANIKQRMSIDKMNEKLSNLYVQDALTGLYNRFGFEKNGQLFFEEKIGAVNVFCIDIDGLKTINDCYGHKMGDLAIGSLANAIREVYSDDDILIRMGGDEFLVLTEYCVEEEAEKQKEAVLKFLSDYKEQEKLQFELTASIGYVCNSGMDATVELDDLYHAADKKMYDIKSKKHSKTSKRSRIIWGNI